MLSWRSRTSLLVGEQLQPAEFLANFESEIYRIVSSKALDSGDAAQAPVGGVKIPLGPSDSPDAKSNKCC
jgi:hypothetical protein